MGFGNGYGRYSDHGGKRYNNAQVAHVWNSQSEGRGQSNNGNVYFDGPALYSYGSHFLTGYIMPDGVALLNADSYSVSTSAHQSEASSAVRNRATFHIAGLTGLADMLRAISAGNRSAGRKREARDTIRKHAEALAASHRIEAGESRWRWNDELGRSERLEGGESAGEYLTRMAGLPAASWPKLQREAAKAKAKREAAEARDAAKREAAAIAHWADMADSTFADAIKAKADGWNPAPSLARFAKEIRRLKLAAKRRGFSKRRLDSLRARDKLVRESIEHAEALKAERQRERAIADAKRRVREDVQAIRDAAEVFGAEYESGYPSTASAMRHLAGKARNAANAAERLALRHMPAATRAMLANVLAKAEEAGEALASEAYRVAEAERQAERERREAEAAQARIDWLAGVPGARAGYFDSEHGGAALRIVGDELQTSHGASVPLAHAVKAFRFIKLCRERGEAWARNGRTVRVGHFQIDRIEPSGDFKAGCHDIRWPEVERVAKLAGVFDCPADDAAAVPSAFAA